MAEGQAAEPQPRDHGLKQAVFIAEKCGVTEPAFYGEVTIRIAAGGVSGVDVKQTFKP